MRQIRWALLAAALFGAGLTVAYVIAAGTRTSLTNGDVSIGGPFSLVGADGNRVTDRDFRGKLMLVFFGYTHCPDVCPTELQTMSDVLDKLGPAAGRLAPVFITVDPKRDTPEVLSNYVKAFNPRIAGLTGTPEEVASAARAYRVYFRKAPSDSKSEDYSVDHSAFVYLMSPDGKYLTHFTFETTPQTMIDVIKKHMPDDVKA